jgi:pseudouridine-5'-phosphate glycosidase
MPETENKLLTILPNVKRALDLKLPVVALESTVITHGLPKPHNLSLALDMEQAVRSEGGTPATIALLDGKIRIGLTENDLDKLAAAPDPVKVSRRDFAAAVSKGSSGGTTVAGTMFAAHKAGIQVFATGGIGGVHRDSQWDVSTDLQALADTPMIVVCAGAKSILDLAATLEVLETLSVPVIGYQTDDFPAFYSRESGLKVSSRCDSPGEIAGFAKTHWELGLRSAVLVVQPVPASAAIPKSEIDPHIEAALAKAKKDGIKGQAVTPFLLSQVKELSGGRAMQANIALLLNNAQLAALIAKSLAAGQRERII